ncbi:MAG: 2-isopropylmalate synthase [Syntrophobacteraceae bacterium]
MRQIRILDTTLRDGTKSPGTILTGDEKIRIAKQLARLRVDVLEPGFPAASEEQFKVCERVAREIDGPVIAVLARATNPRDFEIAWDAVKHSFQPRIHTFVPASREYREHFLKKTVEQTRELAASAVTMAKGLTPDVEFSLVDAFRADPAEVVELCRVAMKAGATVINLADSVGVALPSDVVRLFKRLKEELESFDKAAFSIHCHDDFGLALANSLAALGEGATQVHCTVNGVGERAGNTALEELAAVLQARSATLDWQTQVRMDQIYPTSRLVRRLTGISLQPHKAIVGANAFLCEMDVPQLADATEKPPYEILRPEKLGILSAADLLNVDTTLEQFVARLAELGYDFPPAQAEGCYQAFQELAEKKEVLFDADLEALLVSKTATERLRYKLLYLNVTAGSISVPNATVQLEVDGQTLQDAGFGRGPVDAAFKTIFKMVKRFPRLVRYEVNAVTAGTDAQGEISIRLEENGQFVDGRAVDTDIVLASARALVDGLNKLEQVGTEQSISEFTDVDSWMPRL